MADKQAALDLAAFLDSPFGRSVGGVPRPVVRELAEFTFGACYDELGLAPRLLDAEHVHELVVSRLGAKLARKDARVEHVHEVLDALLEFVAATTVFSQAFEARRALGPACDELVELVRAGRNQPEAQPKQDPFVHGASKLGRNDPCSCGSGKKYKKCHGKDE
ncbi:MAG: SEC-C metal-binding domain-containing protein [Planctomycetota bacterium]|nr:SEC-C metal-binding domain-containing protein [Planctomycetota bacterium]